MNDIEKRFARAFNFFLLIAVCALIAQALLMVITGNRTDQNLARLVNYSFLPVLMILFRMVTL